MDESILVRRSSMSEVEASKSVVRFCVVEKDDPCVLAQVSTVIGAAGVNIVGNTSKVRGRLCFQVLDLELCDPQSAALLETLRAVPGVLSCSVGAFSEESGDKYLEAAPTRLCIVTSNVPGVLGNITSTLGVELALKITAHVNRSRGELAYNVFDVETHREVAWDSVCRRVENLEHVFTCSIGHFKAGDMAGVSAKTFSSAMSAYSFDTGDDDDADDARSEKSAVGSAARSADAFEQPALGKSATSLGPGRSAMGFSSSTLVTPEVVHELVSSTGATAIAEAAAAAHKSLPDESSSSRTRAPLVAHITAALRDEHESRASPGQSNNEALRAGQGAGAHKRGVAPEEAWSSAASTVSASSRGPDYYDDGSKETTRSRKLTLMSERTHLTRDASKLVVVMVGLPARGKSFTARKLKRFLCWRNRVVQIFNAGRYRRERTSSADGESAADRAAFFNSDHEEGRKVRQEAADHALKDLLRFLGEQRGAAVGIFDATNSTHARRVWILEQCRGRASVVFVEVLCDDEEVLRENLLAKIRTSPDFAGMDEQQALEDLQSRIGNYASVYEPVMDDSMSYIKVYNMSTKILANRIYGRLARSILPYMLSLHIGLRPIWFVRAGLSEDSRISLSPEYELLDPSTESKASRLSELGVEFSRKLARWLQTALWLRDDSNEDSEVLVEREMSDNLEGMVSSVRQSSLSRAFNSNPEMQSKDATPLRVFDRREEEVVVRRADGTRAKGAVLKVLCSTLPRAEQTAQIALAHLDESNEAEPCPMLNPLDKGELAGLSMEEIRQQCPGFWEVWSRRSYSHRFPGGESYHDLVTRLEPVLIEIEQQTAPVLVVSHVSCIQALLAYYLGCPVQDAMKIKVPMHKVIEVAPTVGGSWEMNFFDVR